MARYLLALIILIAAGVTVVALDCDNINEQNYRTELEEVNALTRSVSLTEFEEPSAYSLIDFSWSGLGKEQGEFIVLERKDAYDFLAVDSMNLSGANMSFNDPDSLVPGSSFEYRLLLLHKGRASVVRDFSCNTMEPLTFLIKDTVYVLQENEEAAERTQSGPERTRLVLEWKPLKDVSSYKAQLMTLKTLAPVPDGQVFLTRDIKSTGKDKVVWEIDTDKLVPGENYILKVSVYAKDGVFSRSSEGYRLFVFSKPLTNIEKPK